MHYTMSDWLSMPFSEFYNFVIEEVEDIARGVNKPKS